MHILSGNAAEIDILLPCVVSEQKKKHLKSYRLAKVITNQAEKRKNLNIANLKVTKGVVGQTEPEFTKQES